MWGCVCVCVVWCIRRTFTISRHCRERVSECGPDWRSFLPEATYTHTHTHTHTHIHAYIRGREHQTRERSGFCLCVLLLCVCVFCFVCLCGMYTHVYKHRNTFHSESVTLSTAHAAKRRQRGIALLKPLLHGWAAARHGCVRARAQTCHGGEVEHLPISRLTQQALVSAVRCQWVRYRSLVHHFLQHLHCVCSVVRPCKASA
jgi:hypothetical protein